MDTLEPAIFPPLPRRTFGSFLLEILIHHNPFYLLSALCMIAGCYALNSALETRSGELGKLFLLLGTINLYELMLIALGLFLIVRHGIDRDGRTLLLLETVFLVDLTFLNAETAATSFRVGVAVNALLLVLAFAKVGAVLRVLIGRLPVQSYLCIGAQLVTLAAMPCGLKWAEGHGGITDRTFFASWWIAGLVLVFIEMQAQLTRADSRTPEKFVLGVARDIRNVYQVVPYLSLVAHLAMLHWVYKTPFYSGYASPVLIGCAVLIARRLPVSVTGRLLVGWLRLVLPLAAIALAGSYPDHLAFVPRLTGRLRVTPPILTLGAVYLVYVYAYALRYAALFLGGAVAAGLAFMFGPSTAHMTAAADSTWTWSAASIRRLIPQSAAQWGVAAVGGAFAFLGVGASISLRKRKAAE